MNLASRLRRRINNQTLWPALIVLTVLYLAFQLGHQPSQRWPILFAAGIGGVLLLRQPQIGLLALVAAALVVPLEFGTGTEVSLNAVTMLIPAFLVVWGMWLIQRKASLASSPANQPLLLFLIAGLISLIAGNALWDPAVPRPSNLLVVQFAQWGIFVLSAGAFWLTANLVQNEQWLQKVTFFFLALSGTTAVLRMLPGVSSLVGHFTTIAFIRAPFWICLIGLSAGQLLFNQTLKKWARVGLFLILAVSLFSSLVVNRESVSTWAPSVAVLGVLFWLRFAKARVVLLILAGLALLTFFSPIYEFAGGDPEWVLSGQSRVVLIQRVLKASMHNPIFGLGPASYRAYTSLEPLQYGKALWWQPNVSSHNNYVDVFAHTGLVGLGLFLWFLVALVQLGWRLTQHYRKGFLGGYVNSALAILIALMVAMLAADWFLPFVYNIGFLGFQASVLAWMFLGGLVAVENITTKDTKETKDTK